jgi:hypothetical protein
MFIILPFLDSLNLFHFVLDFFFLNYLVSLTLKQILNISHPFSLLFHYVFIQSLLSLFMRHPHTLLIILLGHLLSFLCFSHYLLVCPSYLLIILPSLCLELFLIICFLLLILNELFMLNPLSFLFHLSYLFLKQEMVFVRPF